ncbi:MAG: tetratricopeptide repeat protein [Betaproteobacteria bacterium]|nr:tetratricopeptide repeat protein [Betaproteobacteria bacterium]
MDSVRGVFAAPARAKRQAELDRAVALHESGRFDEAEAIYRALLKGDARDAEALHLLGLAAHQRGRHSEAFRLINAAILAKPGVALFHFNFGNVLLALGEIEPAASAFAEAVRLNPAHAAAWFNLGKVRLSLDEHSQAVAALRRAFELGPELPGARSELARALIAVGDRSPGTKKYHAEAAGLLREHWQEAEDPLGDRLMLAYCLQEHGAWMEAANHYRAVLEARPDPANEVKAHSNLANCYNQLGRMTEAISRYRQTLALAPHLADTASSILCCLNYDPECTPQTIVAEHRNWGRRFADPLYDRSRRHANDRSPERKLRIGYISPDFRRHVVSAMCAPVLERHDRGRYEVCCYYNFPSADAVTGRLRRAAHLWREISGIPDAEVAGMIESDGIDVLVDLAGHTSFNRLLVLARKPAPVQVSWLGYFNTTGLEQMDAFITDPHSSPPGQEAWFTETLVRLPDTRFPFEAHEFYPGVGPPPAGTGGHVTFGSFNNLAKVNRGVLALWARILERTPGARLALQASALEDAANRERFLALCLQAGIERRRIDIRPWTAFTRAALGYHDIDIALDPFPFCGGMTSFDALWMGVPVVTLASALVAGRQTASILANLGMSELVASDESGYVDIAVALARDRERLADLRAALRARFAASPLCDYERFTRALEDAYRRLWRRWVERASQCD